MDSYIQHERISAKVIRAKLKSKHGDYYQTPGYYVRLYRLRDSLTQQQLAKKLGIQQHHLSEMENNKRTIGKKLAKSLAELLRFDYRELL